jgi:hypothetical protein
LPLGAYEENVSSFKPITFSRLRKSCILPQVNVDTKNADSAYFFARLEKACIVAIYDEF